MNHRVYRYIELAVQPADGSLIRSQFASIRDEEFRSGFRWLYGNTDLYVSHCRFATPGRSDDHACDCLFRVDTGIPDDSRTASLRACELLTRRLGVEPESYDIVFDGESGFDIVVAQSVFHAPACPELLTIWKELAHCLERAHIPHLDLDVYRPDYLKRLVNSINSRTGLYVIPVEYRGLADLGMEELRGEAGSPGSCDSMALPTESDKATFWMCRALEWARPGGETTGLAGRKRQSFHASRRRSRPRHEIDPHQQLLFGEDQE